jgi:cell division protein FtsB
MKELLQTLKQNKRARFLAVVVPLAVMFVICSSVVIAQSADINRLRKQEAAYSAQLAAQEEENDRLIAILESDDKDSYIEQKAREKGYVKSDEVVFYDIAGSN